ncbi:MAG: YfhO family protein [Acidobacteriota bacterium]
MAEARGAPGTKAVILPGLLLLLAAGVYFAPFLFQGRHLPSFHFESGRATGIPNGGAPPSIHRVFPNKDNSPVFIHYPNAAFTGACLREGSLPLWNPFVGCGTPGLGGGQVYPFSPFLWPFYLHPGPRTFTLGLLLGCLWCGLGGYAWLGRFRLSPWPRAFGAVLWAFNPYTLRILTFSNVWAAWWFGWLLWAWDRCLDPGDRKWWLPSVMVAGMVYCGHPEESLLLAAGSGLYALIAWASGDGGRRLSAGAFLSRASAAAGLAGVLAAVHLLPVLARLAEAYTYKFDTPERVTRASLAFESLLNPRTEAFVSPVFWGFAILALAGLSRPGAGRRLWPVLAVLSFATLLLFRPIPWPPLMDALTLGGILPGLYARGLFWFAAAGLAAAGANHLWEAGASGRWAAARQILLGGMAFAGLCWAAYLDGAMVHILLRGDLILAQAALLTVLAAGALILQPGLRAGVLSLALAASALSPLLAYAPGLRFYEAFGRGDPARGGPPAVEALRSRMEMAPHGRFYATGKDKWKAPDLSPDLAGLWEVRDVRVVDALLQRRYVLLETALSAPRSEPVATWLRFDGAGVRDLGLLGVAWMGSSEDATGTRFRWESTGGPLDRAFLVHRVASAGGEEEALRRWMDLRSGEDVFSTAVLEGWPGGDRLGEGSSGGSVRWLLDGRDRVELAVTSPSPAVLVLLDAYASGWKAVVNGASARVYPANVAFRAVEVPAGASRVVFTYRPASVRLGLFASAAGWVGILLLALRLPRRRS